MGSRQDAIMGALEANGPMTVNQISEAIYGSCDDTARSHVSHAIRSLRRFGLIDEVGRTMGRQGNIVMLYWFADRPVPPVETADGTTRDRIIRLLDERGPMTVRELTVEMYGDDDRVKSVARTVSKLSKCGRLEVVGRDASTGRPANLYVIAEGSRWAASSPPFWRLWNPSIVP